LKAILKSFRKTLQNLFKNFFYKIFLIFHGKIIGIINGSENKERVVIEKVKFDNLEYKLYSAKKARLYTDRINDTAVILDNLILEGPSFQIRQDKKNHLHYANAKQNIVFTKGTPRKKRILKGKLLSLLTGGAGNENYFHWIYDVLPRFALVEKFFNLNEFNFFLVPDNKKKFQIETLELLKIPKNKFISSMEYRHIYADEIVVTDHPYVTTGNATHDIQNMPAWLSKWLCKKFLKATSSKDSFPKRIYIDRTDSTSNSRQLRSIINENEIKNFLSKLDFTFIKLADYHFIEQSQMFNNADFIIGLNGAGFANICFCKPGTKVIEITSNTEGKVLENLGNKNELKFKSIKCEPQEYNLSNQMGHIHVSVDYLKKIIESLN
tara:strand:+ start:2418 stop:3557 length:1140 start_codon:yes stop_codon:yes gene_type:complete